MDKKILFLIIFGMIIFGIRLFNINEAIYDDESNFAYSLTVMDKFGFNHDYYSPQPLNLLYKPFIALFGLETWVFRIVPWLFGIINTVFVYYFAKRNWGRRVAFWAAFLMLVAFYPTLASLQFDVEGNLVMFSVLLMFFAYLEYEKAAETGDKKRQLGWQIVAGTGLGIAVICKYNAVYIVVILALYSLIKRKWNFKSFLKDVSIIYLVGSLLFLTYLLSTVIISPGNWLQFALGIGKGVSFERYGFAKFSILGAILFLLWGTVLLFGFYILSLFKRKKENLFLFLWITITILFYTFVITYGSIDRYFMHTIPALSILGGYFISKTSLKKGQFYLGIIIWVLWTLFLFLINSLNTKYVARFPSLYFEELKQFNLDFLFSYTSASGPTFGVNFATIFYSFLIGIFFLVLYLTLNKKKMANYYFVTFLSISLAFNVFLISEYIFHPTGINVSSVKREMIDYVKENNLAFPIYTNDQGIMWYFKNDYWGKRNDNIFGFGDNEIGSYPRKAIENINKRGGTLVLLHWPPLPKESPAWVVVGLCDLNKQFFSKGILMGEVYNC